MEVDCMSEFAVESSAETMVDLKLEKPIRVLHVDDEPSLLRIAKQCLEMENPFQVDTASSVEEALEKMKKQKYDAIVCDYQMPEKDGLELLKELKVKGDTTPFIVFTGKGREEVAIRALNLGASQYLNKTGDPETVYYELAHAIFESVERRRTEELLRRSETRYRQLFETLQEGVCCIDKAGHTNLVNPHMADMLGYKVEDMIGKLMSSFVDDRSKDIFKHHLESLRRRMKGRLDLRLVKKDGSRIYATLETSPITDENGNYAGAISGVIDVTEQKKAQEAVKESEEKYRDLFENATDVICTLDLEGNVTAVNNAILRFGYHKENVVGKNILAFVSEQYWSVVMNDLPQVAQGKPVRNEIAIDAPEGKIIVEYSARAIMRENTVVGLHIILRDVTGYKKVEEALRSSEAKLRAILASSPDAIAVFDLDAKFTDCNEAFLKLYGCLSKEELIGKDGFDVVAPRDRPRMQDAMKRLLEVHHMENTEFALLKSDGQEFIGELSAGLTLNSSGKPESIIVVGADITERKRAEEKLGESEEKFRSIFESANDCMIYVDASGIIRDANQNAVRAFAGTKEEMMGKKVAELEMHLLEADDVQDRFSMALEGNMARGTIVQVHVQNKKGQQMWLECSPSLIKGDKEALGMIIVARDVTDKVKAEERLRESEEKFKNLAEQSPDMIFINKKGRIVYANKKAEQTMGYSKEEFYSPHFDFLTLIAPEFQNSIKLNLARHMKGEDIAPLEYKLVTRLGRRINVILNSKLITYEGESAILGTVTEITDRSKCERTVLESQRKFEGLFMSNPEAAVYLGPDFHILDINPRFKELFGKSLDEIRGKHINDVIVREDMIEGARMLDKNAIEGYVYHDTMRMKADGTLVPVSISAAPIIVEGQLMGYVGVYKDISQRKQAETELAIMNEKLRVVGGLTRHDARNKLASVTGNVFLAKKRLGNNPEALKYLREIESACNQVVEVFDFASTYEKLGAEKLIYVDVGRSFEEAIAQFPNIQGIEITNKCHGLTVLADSLLRRLFYNLVDNSLKYGQRIRKISAHFKRSEKGEVDLIYEDDGVGISDTDKPKLFKEGYGKGTGYGLYLIRKMTEVYGWTIRETGKEGQGAQFTITIPKTSPNGKENYHIA
jgi:PAS domain S-box-containing protein